MRVRRGILAKCLIIFIASIVIGEGFPAYGAMVDSVSDQPEVSQVPDTPIGVFDESTPGPTPSGSPEATQMPEPDGYQLDGNDYLAVVSADGISFNVNGLALEKIAGYAAIRFDLEPLNGAAVQALYLKVLVSESGNFDFRLADFETETYRLKMKYPKGGTMQEMELKPNSRILFSANYMEAILFDGEEPPVGGAHPSHSMAMEEDETTILVGAKGSLILESRPVAGSYTPPAQEPETNNPGPTSPGTSNPSTSNPPGTPSTPLVPRVDGQLGGSGLLSCALNSSTSSNPYPILLGILGMSSLALLRRFRSSK